MLDKERRKVLRGIGGALAITLAVAIGSLAFDGSRLNRTKTGAATLLVVLLPLAACIARLAAQRFFTFEDLAGSALTAGTPRARLLQSLLQNTLEQTVLVTGATIAATALLPATHLTWVVAVGGCFVVGRVLFFAAYAKGAGARALGFGLTFYPTIVLIAATLMLVLAG